ncbi:MAG: SpoIIE family protein phosphatase [Crocinitomicaceae bacterium]|nr:SpoIIE family protein phosphatase [Crocinitomicaceae bacterium]
MKIVALWAAIFVLGNILTFRTMITRVYSVIFFLALCLNSFGQDDIYAKHGVIDLSDWDIQKSPYLRLQGDFEFYWNELIRPGEYTSEDSAQLEYQSGSNNWNHYNKGQYPAIGYVTYRLHVQNLPEGEMNLMTRSVTCASAVYVDDILIGESGKVGTSKDDEQPHYEDKVIPIPPGKRNFTLTILLSNHQHRNGGFNDPWYLGTEESLYNLSRKHIMLNGIESSSFLFAGLFFFTLYIFRRKDKALLYFSLYALTFSIRPLVSFNYMIITVWPDMNWHLLVHIEYLSLFLPGGFMLLFIRERFKEQAPQKLLLILTLLTFAEALITIIFPPKVFTQLPLLHQLISFVSFGVLIYVVVRAMKERVSGAAFAGIAIICLITSSTYTIFLYLDIIPPAPYSYTALQMAFLLSMTMILGSKFASQFRKAEYLQEETEKQKIEIEEQHQVLELKNEEITSSITYARRIQSAILPPKRTLSSKFSESFILYKPKDIVAGDFYWVEQLDDTMFIAAADCTGHGVPGAMVSVVCNSALNRCIREFNLTDPGQILDKTRELVIETFDQSEEEVKDGMDIALISLNTKTLELKFAGANNPLWIVKHEKNETLIDSEDAKVFEENGYELIEFKGDKQPIGVHFNPKPFHSISLKLTKGETIYLFSDGYADQFGGDKGKKFMYKSMKKLVLAMQRESVLTQHRIMDEQFENWRGGIEQTDDVCVIAIKV